MHSKQVQILSNISLLRTNQIYLLSKAVTPQQQWLHLFGHRHLFIAKMYHKNLPQAIELLKGTMAQHSLSLAYTAFRILNRLDVPTTNPLKKMVNEWINVYDSLRDKSKFLFNEMVTIDSDNSPLPNYPLYMQFIDLISTDLLKLLKPNQPKDSLYNQQPFNDQIEQIKEQDHSKLVASDLLMFLSSCIPKVLLNILLKKETLPQSMKHHDQYECLYVDREAEFILRRSSKITHLLKIILITLLDMPLNATQQKFLMLMAMRYYYTYHHLREALAPQIIVQVYNKLDQSTQRNLADQIALFFRIIIKLGKKKFVSFLAKNSLFLRKVLTVTEKNAFVGYTQEAAVPYNSRQLAQTILIGRGRTQVRYFQVLEILIQSLDVTVRLFYLGDFNSEKEVKIELLTHERHSNELKRSINAMKRGIYMFQFDNSQSWINPKTIIYQIHVYSPLQIKTENAHTWIENFYQGRPINRIAQSQLINLLPESKKKERRELPVGVAYLKQEGSDWVLRLQRRTGEYTYVTDNPERMQQKIKQVVQVKDKFKWTIMNRLVDDIEQVYDTLRGREQSSEKMQKRQESSELPTQEVQVPGKKETQEHKQEEEKIQENKKTEETGHQITEPAQEPNQSEEANSKEINDEKEAQEVRQVEREILERTVTEEDETYEVKEHEMEQSQILNQEKIGGNELGRSAKREEITLDECQIDFYTD